MGIFTPILRAVTWWNGQTIGTQLFTWRKGVKVGEDAEGNLFYRNADDSRRWVIFNGEAEASRITPRLARLAAPDVGHAALRIPPASQGLGKAASGEPDRHRCGLFPARLDPPGRPQAAPRLRGMAAGVSR